MVSAFQLAVINVHEAECIEKPVVAQPVWNPRVQRLVPGLSQLNLLSAESMAVPLSSHACWYVMLRSAVVVLSPWCSAVVFNLGYAKTC